MESHIKKVLIKACTNSNLGDDLFVRSIIDRYVDDRITFYVLVYKKKDYKYLQKEYKNVVLVKYPCPMLGMRVAAKIQEKILKSFELKKIIYRKAYQKLFKQKYDIFVNVGGSQFAEYEGETFILPLYLEKIIIENIKAKSRLLLNINFGPYKTEKYRLKCERIFKQYDTITFRDYESKKVFYKLKNAKVYPDLVLGYDFNRLQELNNKEDNIICINVINLSSNARTYNERHMFIETYNKIIENTVKLFLKAGREICFVGFTSDIQEEKYIDGLIYKIRKDGYKGVINKLIYHGDNYKDIILCMKVAKAIISTRFHSLIIAMALNKRQYPICYDNKMVNFLKSIEYKEPYSTLNNMEDEKNIYEYLSNEMDERNFDKIIKESAHHFDEFDRLFLK